MIHSIHPPARFLLKPASLCLATLSVHSQQYMPSLQPEKPLLISKVQIRTAAALQEPMALDMKPNREQTPRPRVTLGGKGYYTLQVIGSSLGKPGQELGAQVWRQERMQKPSSNAAYWLAHHSLLSLISHNIQKHQARSGTTHPGWALSYPSHYELAHRPAL